MMKRAWWMVAAVACVAGMAVAQETEADAGDAAVLAEEAEALPAEVALLAEEPILVEPESRPVFIVEGIAARTGGEVSYRIGESSSGQVGPYAAVQEDAAWASRLDFPIDMWVVGAEASLSDTLSPSRGWRVRGSLLTNLTDPDEKMRNRDWYDVEQKGVVSGDGQGDYHFYSFTESDAEVTAWFGDVRAELWSEEASGWYALFVGYRQQTFGFDIYGLSGYVEESGAGTGYGVGGSGAYEELTRATKVGEYDVTMRMPYLGMAAAFDVAAGLRASVEGAFSPYATASDEDFHLLRAKKSEGDTDGVAWFVTAAAQYDINADWFARFIVEYLDFKTEGDQTQRYIVPTEEWPGGVSFRGTEKIESEQTRIGLALGRLL